MSDLKTLKQTVELSNNRVITFTYTDTNSPRHFTNITQSYGLCFTKEGLLTLVRSEAFYDSNWLLPGGTVEDDETPLQTLHREVMEEADITLKEVYLLGGQICTYPKNPSKKPHAQLRYAAIIDEVLTQTPDPDNGIICQRTFVKAEELNNYLRWGEIGEHIQNRAIEWFLRQQK